MRADPAPTIDDALRSLRPDLRESVERALAVSRSIAEPRRPEHHAEEGRLWGAILDTVGLGLPLDGSWSSRPIRRASDLTKEQRAVATVLALTPGPYLMKHAIPSAAWVRRQWLGIDEPGPLFRSTFAGEPLFHAVRAAEKAGTAAALLDAIDPSERTASLVDLALASLDAWTVPALPRLREPLPGGGASAGAWAVACADRLLAVFAPDAPDAERGNRKVVPVELARAAFLALLRAGIVIEPRWDSLLPLETWMPDEERRACIHAIPPERRPPAVAAALARIAFDHDRLAVARSLVEEFPFSAVVRSILAAVESARDGESLLATLREAARRDAASAKLVHAFEAKLAKAPRLRVGSVVDPVTRGDLDPELEKQLIATNLAYGGRRMSVESIAAEGDADDDTVIRLDLTRVLRLVDETGRPTYDVWLTMGDSGSVFEAGSKKRIASIIQGDLEGATLAIRIRLREAIAAARRDRSTPSTTDR